MAQQTAVDWLILQVNSDCTNSTFIQNDIIEQAKAIEKEQIIKAACYEPFLGELPKTEGEHYYNKTFNK
jgi:hypothetical protein